jgi:hypothetical protein
MSARHWSEAMHCSCGASFRSCAAEAFHRHNFPALCRVKKGPRRAKAARANSIPKSPLKEANHAQK